LYNVLAADEGMSKFNPFNNTNHLSCLIFHQVHVGFQVKSMFRRNMVRSEVTLSPWP